ncbi:hypothetical protein BN873_10153 [Candidatus Competibacter denitrificans Run_A_D11]|uniref:NADP-dependent oxidoreductase domain-containing protein n=1 Tax=Candidatus Competibacter denitrificans Run_A_D11 TaxID=1400863 RepID=W6M0G5_9GAMM|nr:hypothetical protein BN873_10153 [Candidatus Competibacter denitrificans Run_A_D11]
MSFGGGAFSYRKYPEGDFRRGDPRYQGKNFDANMRAAEVVRKIAQSLGVKPGQVAIAWLLHQGSAGQGVRAAL